MLCEDEGKKCTNGSTSQRKSRVAGSHGKLGKRRGTQSIPRSLHKESTFLTP